MRLPYARRGIAGLLTAGVLGLVLLALGPRQPEGAGQPPPPARKPRPEGTPVAMPANLVGLEIHLGVKDTEPTPWAGAVELSEGKLLAMSVRRGGANARVDGPRFTARSVRQQQAVNGPVLRIDLDAPAGTTVTLKTRQGDLSFKPADLPPGTRKPYLDGKATVEREEGAVRLTGRDTEDDYPALAKGPDGTVWLAYVEYRPSPPVVMDRVKAGGFEELAPKGNGDQILLVRFDGKSWSPPLEVTDPGLDVWRPAVAVDGQGVVWVAWAQQADGDWEVFHRRYTPGPGGGRPSSAGYPGRWSEVTRVTRHPGTDFNVAAAADAAGVVWLAWQSWREDNFDVMLSAQADGHPWREPRVLSTSQANDWSPAIAADGKGNVYVAYDTYDQGNYDVLLAVVNKEARVIPVATSAKFEARPHLACDAQGRVWIAYEEGDEQWGKDYAHAGNVSNVGLEKNPGFALYVNRTVRVKCLADGRLLEPAGDLQDAFAASPLRRNKSLPRLAVDASGGVWLLVRHHLVPGAMGEAWASFAFRYDGSKWGAALPLADSANLMDVRPALIPFGPGVLAVYSGDDRIRTQNRDQADLFAAALRPSAAAGPPQLVAAPPPPAAKLATVHPREAEDVARMRAARAEVGGKKLRFLRGEFHRHTEYGSHNDGDGLLEDAWRYGLDPGALDWVGVGDHDNGFGVDYYWWTFQKVTDLFHNPPRFVAAHVYERSVVYPNGHRNVIMPRRGVRPLPRHEQPVAAGTEEKGSADTKMLYAYLKHFGGMCASHTSATNMGTDWRDNDPDVEPVVEIYQGHRHNYEQPGAPRAPTREKQIGGFEPKGFINLALDKGYRLGFQASSDHVSTHISYGMVLTDDVSRQGVIDAFKKRHSYAATDNVVLDVRCGGHLMGEAFELNQRPTLDVRVTGTGPVAKVHVLRNNQYVYTGEPKTQEVTLRYADNDPPAGKASFYYVRVEQADGNLAWSSPLWITFKP
jgi:hypothetical protein